MYRFLATIHDLPAGPPPEVLGQIDVAWKRAKELFKSDLELRFGVDALVGSIAAELRCADGSLRERFSASEAIAFACGDVAPSLALAA